MISFLNILSNKYIIGGLIVTALLIGAYLRGRHAQKMQEVKETVRHFEEVYVEEKKTDQAIHTTVDRLRKARATSPKDDQRDSCLLSNDPLSNKCFGL